MAEIRYGLIGAGMMGQEHIRNINLQDDAVIAAISDPDDGMRTLSLDTAGTGARGFADHKDLLSADICDAYVIAAPNDTHRLIMEDVLGTSKPILCEKPLCTTSSDCRVLIQMAEGRSAPVWVAMEYRYMPPVQRLLIALEGGEAGAPHMMSIREHRFPFLVKVGDWNRFKIRTGGTMVEKCCHFWDLMRLALKSDPVRVYASAAMNVNHFDEHYDGETPDILDNCFAVIDFENGNRAMLDLCMFAEGSYWQETISVTGDKARLDVFVPGAARHSREGTERQAEFAISNRQSQDERREVVHVDEDILAAGSHHGSTYYQHQRFLALVRRGSGEAEVSLRDGYWSVLIGEAAEKSARTGRAISLKSGI